MNELMSIRGQNIAIKEYQGQRLVTFRDIDQVHGRPEGTARKRFNENRRHFIDGTDFFSITQPSEIRTLGIKRPQGGAPGSITLLTETGYLMLVKSFTDELAWVVQRELVRSYFRMRGAEQKAHPLPGTLVRERVSAISRESAALTVLGEMYERLSGEDHRKKLSEAMELVAFDIATSVSMLRRKT